MLFRSVVMGLFALTPVAVEGANLQLVNHGLSSAGLFALVGMLYERFHTRSIANLGGVATVAPWLAVFFLLFTFSSIGLPGLNGFVGEFLILAGSFQRAWTGVSPDLQARYLMLALAGVVFGPDSGALHLAAAGYRVAGTTGAPGAGALTRYTELDWRKPWAIVFGSANRAAELSLPAEERLAAVQTLQGAGSTIASVPDPDTMHRLAWLAFADILVFFGVLLVGFAYLWRRAGAFVLLIVIEMLYVRLSKHGRYQFADSATSLSMGLGNQIFKLFTGGIAVAAYFWVSQFRIFDLGTNLSGFIGARVTVKKPAKLYLTFDEMLRSDCDAVLLATPHSQHAEIGRAHV